MSNATNKVDAKGRVSLPAAFRQALGEDQSIVAFPSYADAAIEACDRGFMKALNERFASAQTLTERERLLGGMLFGESVEVAFDSTGRIVLPGDLMKHAGITDTAVFVGQGPTFLIWAPERHAAGLAAKKQAAEAARLSYSRWPVIASGEGA